MKYAGATGRLDIDRLSKLKQGKYMVQVKHDGCYVRVETGQNGKVKGIWSRTGRRIKSELFGAKVFDGAAVLHGELEAHTEGGIQAAQERGYELIHLFDINHEGPYKERLERLWRGKSAIEIPDNIAWRGDRKGTTYIDDNGHLRSCQDNRFVSRIPRDFRRFPITQTYELSYASTLWDRAKADDIEGFVVCNMDARMGQRGGKRKVKPEDTLDCIVLIAETRVARVKTFRGEFTVSSIGKKLAQGDIVEIRHNGWYKSGTPRFPRIIRKRTECQRNQRQLSSTTSAKAARSQGGEGSEKKEGRRILSLSE